MSPRDTQHIFATYTNSIHMQCTFSIHAQHKCNIHRSDRSFPNPLVWHFVCSLLTDMLLDLFPGIGRVAPCKAFPAHLYHAFLLFRNREALFSVAHLLPPCKPCRQSAQLCCHIPSPSLNTKAESKVRWAVGTWKIRSKCPRPSASVCVNRAHRSTSVQTIVNSCLVSYWQLTMNTKCTLSGVDAQL